MRKRFGLFSKILALVLIDILFFGYVNPVSAYAVVIIVGFVLLVVNIYVAITLLLGFLARVVPLSDNLRRRLRIAVTLFTGLLIAMQSIGQLTLKDMFAIIPLVLLLAFYLSYQQREQS